MHNAKASILLSFIIIANRSIGVNHLINTHMEIGVYYDSNLLALEWLPKILKDIKYKPFWDIAQFEADSAQTKIAFTSHRLNCDADAYLGFEDKINKLAAISDLVFSWESELHNFHWTIWEQCHHDNVYWVLPGYVNDREDINSHIICWGDWFKTTTNLYKQLPGTLEQLQPYYTKPKMFDALLGSPKPHRDFVFNYVNDNNLNDKFIMTYGGDWRENSFYAEDYFIWEPGCEPLQTIIGTADFVNYKGVQAHLSQVIPIDVYNKSMYSIVAETDFDNTLSCFTEKTAKAFLSRRLFIAITGYKFLHNLRCLGFKTFSDIIDESYDLILDDNERYAAAMEQARILCNTDPHTIIPKLTEIAEYNYNLIWNRDWTDYTAQQVRDCVLLVL